MSLLVSYITHISPPPLCVRFISDFFQDLCESSWRRRATLNFREINRKPCISDEDEKSDDMSD